MKYEFEDDLPSYERSVSKKQAIAIVQNLITLLAKSSGLTLQKVALNHPDQFYVKAEVQGKEVAVGFGKGSHAEIGAFGECLEHYHLWRTAKGAFQKRREVAKAMIYQGDIFLRIGNSLTPNGSTVHAIQHEILGSEEKAYVPALFFGFNDIKEDRPFKEFETFYGRYSCSSGSSFGFSHEDALLHAVLEVIERDEISKLFLNILGIYRDDKPYELPDSHNFHPEVEAIFTELATLTNSLEVQTLVRRSEFGPFFSFSFIRDLSRPWHEPKWGAGCSLFRDLAIYRSLAECQQSAGFEGPREDGQVSRLAKRCPAFKAVSHLQIARLNLVPCSYQRVSPLRIGTSTQLRILCEAIHESGRNILFYDHPQLDPSYFVTTAMITDVERFFGIIFAQPVLPIGHLRGFDSSGH